MIEFEILKSVKSIEKLSRSRIRLMFQFLKNIHFETPNEGKPIFTAVSTTRTAAAPPAPVRWQSCPLVHNNNIHRRFARACEWIYGIIHHIILVLYMFYRTVFYIIDTVIITFSGQSKKKNIEFNLRLNRLTERMDRFNSITAAFFQQLDANGLFSESI